MADNIKNFLKADKSEILRYMGYKGQEMSTELNESIDEISELCHELSEPRYTYGYFDLDFKGGFVSLGGTDILLPGKDIYNHLLGAKHCAVMAVTLGMPIEKKLLQLEKTNMTEALILDCSANALIESLADYVQNLIEGESSKENLHLNFRFSPGYGDFPIETQKLLIPLLSCDRRIGLTVTESSIMIPRKSVTAIIGIFDKKQEFKKSGCQSCNLYNTCNIRKGGGNCAKK